MIDFIHYFKKRVQAISPTLNSYGYYLVKEYNPYENRESNKISCAYDYTNFDNQIILNLSITKFNNSGYIISFNLFNEKNNDQEYTWRVFFLNDYIDDNNLKSSFIYKIDIVDNVEAFIDQYFKNLEFALNDYLKPYVTGEKHIDHYQRMRDQFYEYTSFEQEEKKIIKEHLAKQGKMAVFRQKVIGLKQDVRNYMDKVKNFFLPPNLR